jgi:hypothetical protein
VQREGVTIAARKLGKTGAISYSRGRLTIVNRQELECRAGESYRVLRWLSINNIESRLT